MQTSLDAVNYCPGTISLVENDLLWFSNSLSTDLILQSIETWNQNLSETM